MATPEGEAALQYAVREANQRSSDLTIVPTGESTEFPTADHLELLGGLDYEITGPPPDGDAAELMIDTAAQRGAEMIIIGLRKRNPVGKLILGSNAQRILLDAGCPVLTVKPDTAD
nr:universal stress protein [Spelaeicoccus albus]